MGRYITQDPIGLSGGLNNAIYPTNPIQKVDPLGLNEFAAALPVAGIVAAADGPLPIGDIIALVILAGAGIAVISAMQNKPSRDPVPNTTGASNDPEALSSAHRAASGDRTKVGYGGNCTPDEYDGLRDATKDACKDPANGAQSLGGCFPEMTPFARATRIQQWTNCAKARENEANRCFAGGDTNHKQQINQAWKVVSKCGG
jgi:uncharacterized protein RhaS with RHS repeats